MDFNCRLPLLLYGPDTINRVCGPVLPKEYDDLPKLTEYMENMMRYCHGNGLAAPQVGVFKSFIIYEKKNGGIGTLVNPYIERMLGKELDEPESSLSLPPVGNECSVPRMEMVLIHASTMERPGYGQTFKLVGSEARVVQQEIDCLSGTFFVDRVPEKRKRFVLDRYKGWKHAWELAGRPFPY